ncbi:MAG: hypothetical protein AB1724_17180 [Thermodesulfobacteriota bacterium]
MNNFFKCLSCVLLIFLLAGDIVIRADDAIPSPGTETPSLNTTTAGAITVALNIAPRQDKGKLYFDVETNLPDGMRFMASIRDEYGFVCKAGSTMERIDVDVENGKMEVGPFPFHGKVFPAGEYKFYINSYPAENQPEKVAAVIGGNGARLTGPVVADGIVAFGKEFMISGQ